MAPRGHDLDALIARAQDGDVRAFEQLLQGQLGQLRRFARSFARADSDADDLAQEALVKVYKSLKAFRYQSAFSTWLYTVVRSVFVDSTRSAQGRARAREEALEAAGPDQAADAPDADAQLQSEQEKRRLWRALRALPEEFRTPIMLFDLEGKSYDEVAAIVGAPVGTIRSRLSRGRERLRAALGEASSEAPGTAAGVPSSQVKEKG